MRPPRLGTLFALAACLTISLPSLALSIPKVGEKANGWSITDETYLRTYERCWESFKAQCGRNIVDDQLASGQAPSDERVKASTETMERWLNPPEPTVASSISSDVAPSAPAASTVAPASGGSGCVGMEAESGSAGYDAYNPSGGYIGCYQISPDHFGAGGSCEGMGTDPAGQDACAAAICATEGAGAWTNPSGQNPCGRL